MFKGGEVINKVANRRISKPAHIRTLLQEQINLLRQNDELDPIDRARAIAYLSNTILSAFKDGELADRLKKIEEIIQEDVD